MNLSLCKQICLKRREIFVTPAGGPRGKMESEHLHELKITFDKILFYVQYTKRGPEVEFTNLFLTKDSR